MKIVVCIKQTADGELNPFDASAYEAALRIPDSEVVLVSMGPERTEELLSNLTRLGAKEAYHLCDKAFAGADTLATAYALSQAIKKLQPDLVICGRQTVDGDTSQTGPSLSVMAGFHLITNVMKIAEVICPENDGEISGEPCNLAGGGAFLCCETRDGILQKVPYPALITVERIHHLRLPSIRSKRGVVTRWTAEDIGADPTRCGVQGSPTKVVASFANEEGKRKCKFIQAQELMEAVAAGLSKEKDRLKPVSRPEKLLPDVWIVGEDPRAYGEMVSDSVTVIDRKNFATDIGNDTRVFAEKFAEYVREHHPRVILWGSDAWSKAVAPQVAAILQTGLCADCTALETDGENLFIYRPAFSGNIIAKIICGTTPVMATVRTVDKEGADVICSIGRGAKDAVEQIEEFANSMNWELAASRGAVDGEFQPYHRQVGITGKSVTPAVYIAIGISGAVHHIAGMKQSGTVIAINPDPKAPIFEYADYGIVDTIENVLK